MKFSALALTLTACFSIQSHAQTLYDTLKSQSNVKVDFTVEASNQTKAVIDNAILSGKFRAMVNDQLRIFSSTATTTPTSYVFFGVDYADMNAIATEWEFRIITKVQSGTITDEYTCNKKFSVGLGDSLWSWGRAEFAMNKVVKECVAELSTYLQSKPIVTAEYPQKLPSVPIDAAPIASQLTSSTSMQDKFRELHNLRKDGLITEDEFRIKKDELLKKL